MARQLQESKDKLAVHKSALNGDSPASLTIHALRSQINRQRTQYENLQVLLKRTTKQLHEAMDLHKARDNADVSNDSINNLNEDLLEAYRARCKSQRARLDAVPRLVAAVAIGALAIGFAIGA